MNILLQITAKGGRTSLAHFAIINSGKAGFEIVPLTPEGNAYIARCRGTMKYSKLHNAKSASERMERVLSKCIQK